MKASELRELSDTDLHKRLGDAREQLLDLRFQLATRKLENVNRIREVHKDIARMMLITSQRQHDAAGQAAG